MSLAIMHHLSRGSCAPRLPDVSDTFFPAIIPDPDPSGSPSPLRTAKRAWAAVDPRATHHVVLQDDVILTADFVSHLNAALAARPADLVALYVNWNSPNNSYAVRHAAASGLPWARLVPGEFVPTLGLAMPAAKAIELGEFLARIPDEVRDDDAIVDRFCRERDYKVFAAIPHLLNHLPGPSVAGNQSHGARHATIFLDRWVEPEGYWSTPQLVDKGASMRAAGAPGWDYVVFFRSSSCLIRFIRPTTDEPARHPLGPWRDWCYLLGFLPEEVLDALSRFLDGAQGPAIVSCLSEHGVAPSTAVELWAAAYLLGADIARHSVERSLVTPHEFVEELRRQAIASWVGSGMTTSEASQLGQAPVDALVQLGLGGLVSGEARVGRTAAPRGRAGAGV